MTKKNISNPATASGNSSPVMGNFNIEQELDRISDSIEKHVIISKHEKNALTLWCLGTFCIEYFYIFPRLAVTSPEKRCGKSNFLDLVRTYCSNPRFSSNMSTPSIFRAINEYQPTLILDEADTFIIDGDRDLVGIINSGHSKRGTVDRCVGDNHSPTEFKTYSAMALGSIGLLPPTIMDRSIHVPIHRKKKSEVVERIPNDFFEQNEALRENLSKWSQDNAELIKTNPVEPPNNGNDRAVDNWLPLFTIATQVSDQWLAKCKSAYLAMEESEDDLPLSAQLLSDIRDIFTEEGVSKLKSQDLANWLANLDDQPWAEYKGKRITTNGVANLLKIYGIRPKSVRIGDITPKGYEFDQFSDAFERYLEPPV